MAVATHAPVGFTGTVDEAGEALRFSIPNTRFKVWDATSWAVTSVTTSNLTVSIDPGAAECCGVYDSTGAASTLTLAANGGTTNRLDAIVARWSWGAGATVIFTVLTGTSATVPPAPVRNAGVMYEALLAVVTVTPGVGALPPSVISDVRVYGGVGGPFVIPSGSYAFIDLPNGTLLTIGSVTGPLYQQTASGLVYAAPPGGELGYAFRVSQAGPVVVVTAIVGLGVNFTLPGARKVLVAATAQATSDVAGTVVGIRLNVDGGLTNASTVNVVTANNGQFVAVRSRLLLGAGAHTVNLELTRYAGTGGAYLTADPAEVTVTDLGN